VYTESHHGRFQRRDDESGPNWLRESESDSDVDQRASIGAKPALIS
jgi:hypothetical protein